MATVTIKQLSTPVAVGTAATTLVVAPSTPATVAIVNGAVRFCNTTGGALTITAHAVPNGGAVGTGNMILNAESIAANSHLDSAFPQLGPGDTLQALASGAGITASVLSGVTYQ